MADVRQRAGGSPPAKTPSPQVSNPARGLFANDATAHRVIAVSWLAGVALISWQEMKANKRVPDPNRFTGWTIACGSLDLAGAIISFPLAAILCLGLLVGMLLFRKAETHEPLSGNNAENNPSFNAVAVTPAAIGQKMAKGLLGAYASGIWMWYPQSDPNHPWVWQPYSTQAELKAAGNTEQGDPPGASPPWLWDNQNNKWINTSLFAKGKDIYNSLQAPSRKGP